MAQLCQCKIRLWCVSTPRSFSTITTTSKSLIIRSFERATAVSLTTPSLSGLPLRAPRRDHNLPSKMLDSTALSGAMNGGRPFWLSATSNASADTSSPMSLCPPPTSSPPLLPWFHLRHPPQGSEGVVGREGNASFGGPEEDRLKDKALTRENTSNGCA